MIAPGRRRLGGASLLGALVAAVIVSALAAAATGQVRVEPAEIVGSILHRIGLPFGPLPAEPQGESALWVVRFPRVAMALLVGLAMGCAGALMQGVFGNPLAEPGIVGVSAGAAAGAFLAIVAGVGAGGWGVAGFAFIGGTLTTAAVYVLARSEGRTAVVSIVLTGIAINAFAGAVIGLLTFMSNDDALRAMAFWNLGSLARASWTTVGVVVLAVMIGLAVAIRVGPSLDLLALGDRPARHLGVDVERVRMVAVVTVALLVASGVAFTGIIAFVALVVPHLVRMVAGPAHRMLVIASALGGALVVVTADLLARTLVPYQELPLGVLTALVGGPFFFWLLRRSRKAAGGWAAEA